MDISVVTPTGTPSSGMEERRGTGMCAVFLERRTKGKQNVRWQTEVMYLVKDSRSMKGSEGMYVQRLSFPGPARE